MPHMLLPPIIEWELRGALRRTEVRKTRWQCAFWGGIMTMVFILLAGLTGSAPLVGIGLHQVLFFFGIYIAVVKTPPLTADVFTVERRNRTLGLLFLAGLSPGEIFASKVLGRALVAFNNLLALAPFLAIPFLTGGLSPTLFLATVCCLPNLLLFTLSVTILASALCEDDSAVVVLAVAIGVAVSGITPAVYLGSKYFSGGSTISPEWLLLSPAYGAWMVFHRFTSGSAAEFWKCSLITLGWSCLALTLAAVALKGAWRDKPDSVLGTHWREQLRRWLRGTPAWRRSLGRRWLDTDPFAWLAAHDRLPERLAWGVVLGIATVWLVGWWAWPQGWPSVPNFFLTATLLNSSVEWIAHFTAARRIGEDRCSGAMELLLTTPLQVRQIVEGQLHALRRQFQPVFWATLVLNLAMLISGFFVRTWNWRAVCVYLIVWTPFLCWSLRRSFRVSIPVMWMSLNCGRPIFAAFRGSGLGIGSIAILVQIQNLFSEFKGFPSGSVMEFAFVTLIAVVMTIVVPAWAHQTNPLEGRLLAEFRSIAAQPVPEPSDPRFKKWNIQERFPDTAPESPAPPNSRWEKLVVRVARSLGGKVRQIKSICRTQK